MSDDSTRLDEALKKRKQEAEVKQAEAAARQADAAAEKAAIEASQARRAAAFPGGQTKPLEGETTADEKFGYIAELVAYQAMYEQADEIAETIQEQLSHIWAAPEPRLLIVDSLDFDQGDVQLLQVESMLAFFRAELEAQEQNNQNLPPTPPEEDARDLIALSTVAAAVASGSMILSSVADIVGYFKADYTIKGRDVKLSDLALRSRVAGCLKKRSISVHLMNLHRITESPVIEALNSVLQQRARVKESMALLQGYLDETLTPQTERIKREIQALEAQIKELTPAGNAAAVKQRTERLEQVRPDLDQADADKSRVQQALQRSDALIAALDEFNKQLTATPEGQQYSPLVSAALRKYVQQQEIAYLLYITISSSGGDSITSKERFARSGNLKFLGGCVISYILVDIAGQTVAADTVVKLSSLHYNLEQDDPPEFSS